ncbi:MAG: hypothetical protein HAW67_00745, partial [Endozoicomonadaceae bacterium]|nr:hypothetical protein [Endozoicomonadaceae bacterium]
MVRETTKRNDEFMADRKKVMDALSSSDLGTLNELLHEGFKSGISTICMCDSAAKGGIPSLKFAIEHYHEICFKSEIDELKDLVIKNKLLLGCINKGDINCIQFMIEQGAQVDFNSKDIKVYYLAYYDHNDVLDWLFVNDHVFSSDDLSIITGLCNLITTKPILAKFSNSLNAKEGFYYCLYHHNLEVMNWLLTKNIKPNLEYITEKAIKFDDTETLLLAFETLKFTDEDVICTFKFSLTCLNSQKGMLLLNQYQDILLPLAKQFITTTKAKEHVLYAYMLEFVH